MDLLRVACHDASEAVNASAVIPRARDPRWILMLDDASGSFCIFRKIRDPAEADIAAAEQALARIGMAGWIALMRQPAQNNSTPEIIEVKALRGPRIPFDEARRAVLERVRQTQ